MAALERTATCLLVVFLIGCCQINLASAAHKKSNEDWSNHNELDVISKAGMTPMATSWQRDGAPAATTQQQDHFKAKYGSPLVRDMSAPITDGAAQQQMAKDAVQYANGFSKDSAYSPYPLDAPKQAHSNLKQRNYQAASFPEAGERDQAAMPNNAASGKSLHPMSTKGMDADSKNLQADYAAPVMVKDLGVTVEDGMGHKLMLGDHLEEDAANPDSWKEHWPIHRTMVQAPMTLGPLQRLALVTLMSSIITPFLVIFFKGVKKLASKHAVKEAPLGDDYESDGDDDEDGCRSSPDTPPTGSVESCSSEMKTKAPVKIGGSHPLLSPSERGAVKSSTMSTSTASRGSVGSSW